MPVAEQTHRLPALAAPDRYTILLEIDLENGAFRGEETIALRLFAPTAQLWLNTLELTVDAATLRAGGDGSARPVAVTDEPEAERIRLDFGEPLAPGRYELDLKFHAPLNPRLRGLYKSVYKDPAGVERPIAATQFEATDARRAFPCFDEPAYKATFKLTVRIDPALTAVSNAPVVHRINEADGKARVEFAETPKMSTYLVALVVGPLVATEPVTVDGVRIQVYATPDKASLTGFAEGVARDMLAYYRRYYDIPYPGEKMDLLAIPDFEAGAMENLGAITFRETALLVDPAQASSGSLQWVALVTSHEIAHMWFGDLVTMAWWDDLWLNEAFATWMEYKSVAEWKPEWELWNGFSQERQAAMATDGLLSTRPIYAPVDNPAQAQEMFDVITYQKGASILRMMEMFVGEERFRQGVARYLRKHAFGNARTDDLWTALSEASGQPVNAIMDTWVHQGGYPLIAITLHPAGDGVEAVFRQERFLYDAPDGPSEETGRRWQVPILYRAFGPNGPVDGEVLLAQPETRIHIPGARPDQFLVNRGGHGLYRVHYPPAILRDLAGRLGELEAVERFNLLNDAWALCRVGKVAVADYLDLTGAFREETDRNVWNVLIGSLWYIVNLLPEDLKPAFAGLVRDRVGPVAARLGWTAAAGERDLVRQLRAAVISVLGTIGEDPSIQAEARLQHQRYLEEAKAVDPDLPPALVQIISYTGDERDYHAFHKLWKEARTPEIERRYLFALTGFRPRPLIAQTLADIMNGEIRTQDGPMVLGALLGNPDARADAWVFLKANWDQMTKMFSPHGLVRAATAVASLLTPALAADARAFFAAHPVEAGERAMKQAFERLDLALAFRGRELDAIRHYLGRFTA